MARVCIARRRFSNQVVDAALVLAAAVVTDPITSENSASEIQGPQNDQTSPLNVQNISETHSRDDRIALGKIISCASKMVVLADFAAQTQTEVAVFESSVLRKAIANAVEDDNEVNRNELEKNFQEWARLKFNSGPVTSVDEAYKLCAAPLIQSGNHLKAVDAFRQLRQGLIMILSDIENYRSIIPELHKMHECFHEITPEAVQHSKDAMNNLWQRFMHANQRGGQDLSTDFNQLEGDEELENSLDLKMDDFVTISQEADAETVEA